LLGTNIEIQSMIPEDGDDGIQDIKVETRKQVKHKEKIKWYK